MEREGRGRKNASKPSFLPSDPIRSDPIRWKIRSIPLPPFRRIEEALISSKIFLVSMEDDPAEHGRIRERETTTIEEEEGGGVS